MDEDMNNREKVAIVVLAIAEIAPLGRTRKVTRQDLKDWVKKHFAVELNDRWLTVLLREHVVALRTHNERKRTQKDATLEELADMMIDDIEEAMRRHQIESN
jgi:hypothetical protein